MTVVTVRTFKRFGGGTRGCHHKSGAQGAHLDDLGLVIGVALVKISGLGAIHNGGAGDGTGLDRGGANRHVCQQTHQLLARRNCTFNRCRCVVVGRLSDVAHHHTVRGRIVRDTAVQWFRKSTGGCHVVVVERDSPSLGARRR